MELCPFMLWEEESVKYAAAPHPKTPRVSLRSKDLYDWSSSLEMKNKGNTCEDSGWQQNNFRAFAPGGTATCKYSHIVNTDNMVCWANSTHICS